MGEACRLGALQPDGHSGRIRGSAPLRAPVLARAGGSASAGSPGEGGEGERSRASVPGALVGRAGTAASNRFVERARSPLRSRHTPPAGAGSREDPSHRPRAAELPEGGFLRPPSFSGSSAPPALPGRGGGATGSNSLQHHLGDAPAPPRPLPGVSSRTADRARRAGSSNGSVRVQYRAVAEDSPPPRGRAVPRVSTVAADSSRRAPPSLASREQDGAGWGLLRSLGSGWLPPWGSFDFPQSSARGEQGRGPSHIRAFLGLGLQFAKAWRCNGGSQLEVEKGMGGDGTERSGYSWAKVGPRLRGRECAAPLSSKSPPPLAPDRGLHPKALTQMPKAGSCNH